MADAPIIPMGDDSQGNSLAPGAVPNSPGGAGPARVWQTDRGMSSIRSALGDRTESFLGDAGFDRAPWLAVAFGCGILCWFTLHSPWQWASAIGLSVLAALAALVAWPRIAETQAARGRLRNAIMACALVFAAGIAVVWLRSEMVGAQPMERPTIERVQGHILERQDQPSEDRIRLTLAVRDASTGQSRKIRVNIPLEEVARANARFARMEGEDTLVEGSSLRMRVRLMPPASPMLPGAYDFARAAWFKGLAATGSLLGEVEDVSVSGRPSIIAPIQRTLSGHVREQITGSPGTIAAAFASGDRGSIAQEDADAMRDAGLTHLLAISGLHVSAVIAAA